jgi:hypothetical protein
MFFVLCLSTLIESPQRKQQPKTKTGDLAGAQRAYRAGATDAIRAKNEYGETCMHLACQVVSGGEIAQFRRRNHKSLTPGAYTEKRRADFSKFLFVLIQIDIKMMKKGI